MWPFHWSTSSLFQRSIYMGLCIFTHIWYFLVLVCSFYFANIVFNNFLWLCWCINFQYALHLPRIIISQPNIALAPCLFAKIHLAQTPKLDDDKIWKGTQVGQGSDTDAEWPMMGEPPRGWQGSGCIPRATKEGYNRHGNGSRLRNVARGVGTRIGGWWAAGTGSGCGRWVQASSIWAALCTGKGCGEQVKIDGAYKRNGYGRGGGRI